MIEKLYTRGQLERKISQEIQAFYKAHIGRRPSRVTCQLFGKKLAIIIEDSIAGAEQMLMEDGKKDLAQEVRNNIQQAIRPEFKRLVESIARVEVLDILSDTTIETGRTGVIAILSQTPQVSNPEDIPKVKN